MRGVTLQRQFKCCKLAENNSLTVKTIDRNATCHEFIPMCAKCDKQVRVQTG